MNCPKCGLTATTAQRFCRACGTEAETGLGSIGSFLKPAQRSTYMLGGMIFFLGGTGLAAAGRMIFHSDTVVFAGVLTVLIGMFLIAYSTMMRPRRRNPAVVSMRSDSTEDVMFRAETTRQLVSPVGSNGFGSVTEGTTDLLKVPAGRGAENEEESSGEIEASK